MRPPTVIAIGTTSVDHWTMHRDVVYTVDNCVKHMTTSAATVTELRRELKLWTQHCRQTAVRLDFAVALIVPSWS
jgi:hypothetical protein